MWGQQIESMVRQADDRRRLDVTERRSVEALAEEHAVRHHRQEQERWRQQADTERRRREAAELETRRAQDDTLKAREEAAQQQIEADRTALRKAEQLLVLKASDFQAPLRLHPCSSFSPPVRFVASALKAARCLRRPRSWQPRRLPGPRLSTRK